MSGAIEDVYWQRVFNLDASIRIGIRHMNMTKEISAYRQRVFEYFLSKTRSGHESNDLTQEVFVKVLNRWDDLQNINDINAWIFRISRNTLIDFYRKNNRSKEVAEVEFEIENTDHAYHQDDWMESMLECQNNFLQSLDNQTSTLIQKVDLEGFSQKELAANMGIAYPTVRSKVQRGRAQLKQMFLDACDMEYDSAGHLVSCSHKSSCSPNC